MIGMLGPQASSATPRTMPHGGQTSSIEFNNISKNFLRPDGTALSVLENISFAVQPGQIVALLGPSGSGKTTLLNIAAGLIHPDEGAFRIDGMSGAQIDWNHIGYMFQDDRLLPWRSARDNVALALEAGSSSKDDRNARSLALLKLVGLEDFANAYPHELSGGMRSRVALARSLVTDADILLMDEPFARLDTQTRSSMHRELLRLQTDRNLAILFVTHDAEEAVALSDEILLLSPRPGRIKRKVKVQLSRPRAPSVEALQIVAELRAQTEAEANP